MAAEGPLLTIAEIAVALVGFASIVVAIRGSNPSAWSQQDRFGLANVFAASVGALAGSLAPFPLRHLGLGEATVWQACNVGVGVILIGYLGVLFIRRSRVPPRTPRLFAFLVASGGLFGLSLVASGLGLVVPPGPGLLLAALLWMLLAALAQLGTFLLLTTTDR